MSIYASLLTAGTNSHAESSENANAVATDLLSPGVHGVITNTSGVAPTTGDFGVNAQASPNMTVAVNSGVAYVTATPSSQNSQNLRVRNTASANVTISANSSGSTKYDWLYIQVDATKAANPASDASDVATLVTSRSSSSTTDNGTPPTYGTLLAIITVANGASSITNSNIADKRVRSVAVGGINDTNGNEVIRVSATASAVNDVTITNAATGGAPQVSASGDDTNIDLKLLPKGTGQVKGPGGPVWQYLGYSQITGDVTLTAPTSFTQVTGMTAAATIPSGAAKVKVTVGSRYLFGSAATNSVLSIWDGTVGSGTELQEYFVGPAAGETNGVCAIAIVSVSAGSKTYNVGVKASSGNVTLGASSTAPAFILVECC